MKTQQWVKAVPVGSIPKNEGLKISFGEVEIALFNLGDEYRAIDNRCPHKQGPLADGIVSGKSVFCPLHNLKMSLENGCAASDGGRVKVYPVKVIDETVCIAF